MESAASNLICGQFPQTRLRRSRLYSWSRCLVAEHGLSAHDFIWPLFVRDLTLPADITAMPGVQRFTVDEITEAVGRALEVGVHVVALFPCLPIDVKDEQASRAFDPQGILCEAVRRLKAAFPHIGIITDAALDPYTSHGQDGLVVDGHIHNDLTNQALARHAVLQAQAGADIIAPSDMMDGRVKVIRQALDDAGFENVAIISYAAKYASAFYGPFREALNSSQCLGGGDKKTYQMNPANVNEALREAALDIQEGADMIIVKPGMPCLDVIRQIKENFKIPTLAYQVSGEYAMMQLAAQHGLVNGERIMMESLIAMKRAGADGMLTYAAPQVAKLLKDGYEFSY
jgi:porphobilinogen synthase